MRLVHDHVADGPQAVAETGTRIVIRPSRGDRIDRLAAGRTRTHQLIEVTGFASLEIQMGNKEVLIEPARDQAAARARRIEQAFPLFDLRRFPGRGLQLSRLDRAALLQPALHGGVFLITEAGHRERHAAVPGLASIAIELVGQRAVVLPVDADIQLRRQLGIGRQRLAATQIQHARHQRRLIALGVEHRMEALASPGLLAFGVEKQASRGLGLGAYAVVHRQFVRTTLGTLAAAQIELARRVIAGMAGHALGGEDRLDIALIGEDFGLCSAADEQEQTAEPETVGHETNA